MPMSPYMRDLRELAGHRLLLVPAVAAVIHDALGRVLLVQGGDGAWSLPAGAIDPGETPREAIVRETREETGLDVRPSLLLDVFGGREFRITYANGDEVELTICLFACEITGGELHCDGTETFAHRWVAPADVRPMLNLPYPAASFAVGSGPEAR